MDVEAIIAAAGNRAPQVAQAIEEGGDILAAAGPRRSSVAPLLGEPEKPKAKKAAGKKKSAEEIRAEVEKAKGGKDEK